MGRHQDLMMIDHERYPAYPAYSDEGLILKREGGVHAMPSGYDS